MSGHIKPSLHRCPCLMYGYPVLRSTSVAPPALLWVLKHSQLQGSGAPATGPTASLQQPQATQLLDQQGALIVYPTCRTQ